ncbi:HalOD1 output domain-containing protein [Haloarcula amylovorans]|uniref:HalOD1 output domain-containing protein n=1 Tax=Haloarcula amylovorans TaxID=2562280 RepID=UPI0010764051|nr:HalOD1 output domain-containing protein [Halomicroarcula amylolytica]
MNGSKNLIPRIVDAVVEAEDAKSPMLDPPLADVVDPNSLETLVEETTASDLEIHFMYRGHDVVVNESGRVQVS